ncbi:GNAT family N-acetyltransferase [Sporosarcina sp. FSL K6-3457]|uniref:GNAT family N-acetyltransferase n=1 Tax=Sporosarcina sp. FSL K6-3457 TaxID=2978204 RepID=UPI0030F7DFFA
MERLVIQKATLKDATLIHSIQLKAFKPLLDKYHDFDTSPANETMQRTKDRLQQKQTDYYLIVYDKITVGAIRIVRKDNRRYRVSPIFILPEHQGKGIASATMQVTESLYEDAVIWELDTILEEQKLCGLYEKLGYCKTGKVTKMNERMTIVFYEKKLV